MNTTPQRRPVRQVTPTPQAPRRRSKQESLRIVRTLKRLSLVASTLIFGGFIALVARYNVHASTGSLSGGNATSTATPATQFDSPSDGGSNSFFNNQGGYGFGTGSNQAPVTGSSSS